MKRIFLLLVTSLLSACATMNVKDCQGTNWRDKGYSDALKGRGVWLEGHTKACAKAGVVPNKNAYLAGHHAGSRVFCTFESGVNFGRSGDIPRGICTAPELQQPFYSGYQVGRDIYLELEELRERMLDRQMWLDNHRRHHHDRRNDGRDNRRDDHRGDHNHTPNNTRNNHTKK